MSRFNKFNIEYHCLITDKRDIQPFDSIFLYRFLSLSKTKFIKTIPTYSKRYTTLTHVFEHYEKDMVKTLYYESTYVH